ncbi:tetratricopeptide repeat protein [Adhaeribacter radiodurans]|uniref:Tetratricopeptide repeat protein n=1 Tax=Adhaeribacter radiodurans TaxID=2745197 RepID=A0A7L7L2W8_9BACT|nr:hypothetical protein [Adhaeribacter radiodurans]QMU27138.1 hypothetical protein HUW48_03425 [Adhaeribacter radiodurans]
MNKILPIFGQVIFWIVGLCLIAACTQTRTAQPIIKTVHPDKIKKLYDLGYQNLRSMDTVGALADSLLRLGQTNPDARLKGKILKAKYYWLTGNYQSAMPTVLQALELAQHTSINPELPVIYSIIGNLYKEKKNYLKALESTAKGLEAAQTLQDTSNIIFHIRLKALFTRSYGTEVKDSTLINQGFKIYLNGLKLAESSPAFEKDRIAYYNNIAQIYLTDKKDY